MKEFVYLAAVGVYLATMVSVAHSTECPDHGLVNITHETDCEKYYTCYMGREFNKTCGVDDTGRQLCFVKGQKRCGWYNNCYCLICKSHEDDHKWPDPSDERGYYECKHGNVTKNQCEINEVFDPNTLTCKNKPDNICPPPGSGKVQRYPHDCICEKYYECEDGKQVLKECTDGLWFDVDLLTCRDKEDARCNGREPWCKEDGAYPSTSCYYYYKCENGVKTTTKCRYGTIFDKLLRVCVHWDKGTCDPDDFTTPNPNSCTNWERPRRPNPNDCNRYYECIKGKIKNEKCLQNHYFNAKTLLCDLKDNVNCHNGGNGGSNGGSNGDCPAVDCGKVRYPHEDCEWYYECRNGKKKELKCPSGLRYNKESEMCDLPQNVACAIPKPECPPNKLKPHECQCYMYYICGKDGEKILQNCPVGKEFDLVTLTCVPAGQAKCNKEHKNESFNQNVLHWLH